MEKQPADHNKEITGGLASVMNSDSASIKRWKLLSRALLNRAQNSAQKSNASSDKKNSDSEEVSVRRFTTFNLIQYSDGEETESGWSRVSFPSSSLPDLEVLLKLPAESFSLSDISGFNNTGNVCLWPAEEVMAFYCLQNLWKFRGKSVLELGAGMTGVASLAVATASQAKKVIVSDGNERSCESLTEIVERNISEFPRLGLQSRLSARKILWGLSEKDNYADLAGQMDIILAADCLFFDEAREGLIETIDLLLAEKGEAYLFAPSRHGTFEKFVELAKQSQIFQSVVEVSDYDPYSYFDVCITKDLFGLFSTRTSQMKRQLKGRFEAAIHYTVGKICEDDLAKENGVTFSKQFIASLADTVFGMAEVWGEDLSAFASHGNRAQINERDARLIFRRNPRLLKYLDVFAPQQEAPARKKAKKSTTANTNAPVPEPRDEEAVNMDREEPAVSTTPPPLGSGSSIPKTLPPNFNEEQNILAPDLLQDIESIDFDAVDSVDPNKPGPSTSHYFSAANANIISEPRTSYGYTRSETHGAIVTEDSERFDSSRKSETRKSGGDYNVDVGFNFGW